MNETMELPVGEHSWYFDRNHCQDREEQYRTLNLHINVDEPGNFCCSDGICVSSERVCDNKYHCKDRSDEDRRRCQMVLLDSEYEKEKPPTEKGLIGGDDNTQISAIMIIRELVSIDESKSEFCVVFSLYLKWRDSKIVYTFLKTGMDRNFVKKDNWTSIWLPDITYTTLTGDAEKAKTVDRNLRIIKMGKPRLSRDVDSLSVEEIYEGSENLIQYYVVSQATFYCPFNSIKGRFQFILKNKLMD